MLRTPATDSIRRRMRTSQLTLVVLMTIPALLAISLMWQHSVRYHRVISHVEEITRLNPIIKEELLSGTMDIVFGRTRFEEGPQYSILDKASRQLDRLIDSGEASRIELEVSRRILGTLRGYVDQLGKSDTVDEQIAVNEQIGQVAELFLNMLTEAVNAEIRASAQASDLMQAGVQTAVIVEIALLALSFVVALVAQNRLSRAIRVPIDRLQAFANHIASGQLSERTQEADVEELRSLTNSLNTMAIKLEQLIEQNRKEQENLKKASCALCKHRLHRIFCTTPWIWCIGRRKWKTPPKPAS